MGKQSACSTLPLVSRPCSRQLSDGHHRINECPSPRLRLQSLAGGGGALPGSSGRWHSAGTGGTWRPAAPTASSGSGGCSPTAARRWASKPRLGNMHWTDPEPSDVAHVEPFVESLALILLPRPCAQPHLIPIAICPIASSAQDFQSLSCIETSLKHAARPQTAAAFLCSWQLRVPCRTPVVTACDARAAGATVRLAK